MNEKQRKEVLAQLETSRNPQHIAEKLNVKLGAVRLLMGNTELPVLPGWGKPSLQRHILSRRRVGAFGWPREDSDCLADARRQHDQGKITMCQGRDGDWIIQYGIPMQRQVRRNPYFYGG